MRTLTSRGPHPEEIGALGYFRIVQQHYDSFVSTVAESLQPPKIEISLLVNQGQLEDNCAAVLKQACEYGDTVAKHFNDDLSFMSYLTTLEDARERINVFEDRMVRLLYGTESTWLQQIYPDATAETMLEEAIRQLDHHLENHDPIRMSQALKLHRQFREYLRSLDSAYGKRRPKAALGETVRLSLDILDKEADDIFVLAVSTGEDWIS